MELNFLTDVILGPKTKRDKQSAVGPSEIGGCESRVWHRLRETPVTNHVTLRLASWMGTSIHKAIEQAFDHRDPFSIRYLREVEVAHDGLMGHVDLYDVQAKEVIDWKTVTKKKLSGFPSAQQRTQVHLYGYLMNANMMPVETVTLVAIPRDGNENDIKVFSEPYQKATALAGLEWLERIKGMDVQPDPQMPARTFCRDYCRFYDASGQIGCTGK